MSSLLFLSGHNNWEDSTMTSKVLWGEGLLLRPQHFQRQDAYHEHCLFKSVKAVHPYAWGVELCEIDREALASSMLRVTGLALRFQDGELYEAPGSDELPATIDLSTLAQTVQAVTYYAALPGLKPFNANFVQPGQAATSADNAARFMQAGVPGLHVHAVPGCGHNVAGALRHRRQLNGILRHLIWNPEPLPPDCLATVPAGMADPNVAAAG